MKKTLFALLIFLMLILPACSGQSPITDGRPDQPAAQVAAATAVPAATTAVQDSSASAELSTSYANAVSVEAQLLFGTLKLAGSEQAITKEQAVVLLPLWNNLKTLSQNMGPGQGAPGQKQDKGTPQAQNTNTETQTQVDEVVKQILAVMTPAQIKAIADMQITQEAALSIMQASGVTMGNPQQGSGDNAGNGGKQPPQGTPPAGGPGDNGGQPPSGGQPPANEQSGNGTQNEQKSSAGGMIVPPQLIDTLTQMLEKIAAGETVTTTPTTSANTNGGPAAPSGNGSTDSATGLSTATSAYSLDGSTATQSDQTYTASNPDQSGVYVLNGGNLTLNNATVNTSGNTSSDENSSFYGLNAGVLAASGSTINMKSGTISTTGTGANGVFATGSGTAVNLSDVSINATGDGGHGVMATQGGVMTLTNVNMTTSGAHSAPIATDRGGGTITATGGTLNTSGADSPCYYSTGILTIANSTCNATGSEAVVIEGANSVILTDSTLVSNIANKWAVMIYQSFSGDAQGSDGVFNMTGGSLAYTDAGSPLFYITNTNGHITLKNVAGNVASGTLLKAAGNDRWGTTGSNGGTAEFIADAQILSGNFIVDAISSLNLILKNGSSLTGSINAENTAKTAALTLDASSNWNVSADSHLTCVVNPTISGANITNITGNGHTVTYNSSVCSALNGQTYTLNGGGTLTPSN